MTNAYPSISTQPPTGGKSHRLLWTARILLLAALLICLYLAWTALTQSQIVGCGAEHECDRVLQSRWSHSFGMPVSVPAALAYALLEILSFVTPRAGPRAKRRAWGLILLLGTSSILAAIWMIAVQLTLIHAICRFCMSAHITGVLGILLLTARVPLRTRPRLLTEPADPSKLPLRHALLAASAGLVLTTTLIAGQYLGPNTTFQQIATTDKVSKQQIVLADGAVILDINDAPILGSINAKQVVVVLFDYTCVNCRQLHPRLLEAQRHFGGQFVMLMLPLPLSQECYPWMQRSNPAGYEDARLALAVWLADHSAFKKFDEFMYAQPEDADQAAVRRSAEQLVGVEKLQAELTNPAIPKLLHGAGQVYLANNKRSTSTVLPQLIVGQSLIKGTPTQEQLQDVLAKTLNLTPPAN